MRYDKTSIQKRRKQLHSRKKRIHSSLSTLLFKVFLLLLLVVIAGGMVYLNGKLGEEADYTADSLPRTLLMEYVRYARDSALDVFENNYRSMLLDMQNGRKVRAFELEQTLSPQG